MQIRHATLETVLCICRPGDLETVQRSHRRERLYRLIVGIPVTSWRVALK